MARFLVATAVGRHRAHERVPLALPRQKRQVFADIDSGCRGSDWPKLAAHGVGRFGLEIETVLMGDTAVQENEDHRFFGDERSTSREGPRGGNVGHPQAQQANRPRLEYRTAGSIKWKGARQFAD